MYIFPEMINLGLKEEEDWTSEDHKKVASTVLLGNSNINTRDRLTDAVGKINKIPMEEIKLVTIDDLMKKYEVFF